MAEATRNKLGGLKLSAAELNTMHPSWTDAMIEDYLNRQRNEVMLADISDLLAAAIRAGVIRSYFYGRVY